jgi:hypothetical protein
MECTPISSTMSTLLPLTEFTVRRDSPLSLLAAKLRVLRLTSMLLIQQCLLLLSSSTLSIGKYHLLTFLWAVYPKICLPEILVLWLVFPKHFIDYFWFIIIYIELLLY